MSVLKDHHDVVSDFLDEYRKGDRKNEVISQYYLRDKLLENHPELKRVSQKALARLITHLVEEKGGRKLPKAQTIRIKYHWPILQEGEV